MTKDETMKLVKQTMAAPSCCATLKAAAQTWLDAVGTPGEKDAAAKLKKELADDVCSIDDFIALTGSSRGQKIFGSKAEAMHKAGQDAKAKGGKYCLCDACQAGGKLLDDPSGLEG